MFAFFRIIEKNPSFLNRNALIIEGFLILNKLSEKCLI